MPKIFISYRRGDSAGHAGRLFDHMSRDFSREHVFMDVAGIQPGMDFTEAIDQAVGACDVLLVIIGADWANSKDAHGKRRLEDPNDFVAIETAMALKRKVRVIPVLVQGASLPLETDLPDSLKLLLRRNAFEIRDTRWEPDVRALSEALAQIDKGQRTGSGRQTSRMVKWASGLLLTAGVGSAGWALATHDRSVDQATQPNQPATATSGPSGTKAPVPTSETKTPPTSETKTQPSTETKTPPSTETKTPPSAETKTAPSAETKTPVSPRPDTARCKRIAGHALYAFDGGAEPWLPLTGSDAPHTAREGCEGSGALAFTVRAGVGNAGAGVFVEPQGSRKDWTGKSRLLLSVRAPQGAAPFGKLQVYAISDAYRCTCDWTRDPPKMMDGEWHELRLPLDRGDCQAQGGGACTIKLADVNQIGIKLFDTTAPTTLYVDHLSLD